MVDVMQNIDAGQSIVKLRHISDLNLIELYDKDALGTFKFERKGIFKGTCIFKAEKNGEAWLITKLAIAKKGSKNIDDGLLVFDKASIPKAQ